MVQPRHANGQPRVYARQNGDWVQCGHEDLAGHLCTGVFGQVVIHRQAGEVAGHGGRLLSLTDGFNKFERDGDVWWELCAYAKRRVARGETPKYRRTRNLRVFRQWEALGCGGMIVDHLPCFAVCPQRGHVNILDADRLDLVAFTHEIEREAARRRCIALGLDPAILARWYGDGPSSTDL
jgi:hypothetical protein